MHDQAFGSDGNFNSYNQEGGEQLFIFHKQDLE